METEIHNKSLLQLSKLNPGKISTQVDTGNMHGKYTSQKLVAII
jgi:hypothetical protein